MKNKLIIIFLVGWIISCSAILANLHGLHLVSYKPLTMEKIENNTKGWGMIHILAMECGCSEIIAEYLLKRKPIMPNEKIMFLGTTNKIAKQLKQVGFQIIESKQLDGYIEGVPQLIVFNPDGDIKYSGGYAPKMITPLTKIQDQFIFNSIKNKKNNPQLAVMGCAINKKLQKELDPLGLKYN